MIIIFSQLSLRNKQYFGADKKLPILLEGIPTGAKVPISIITTLATDNPTQSVKLSVQNKTTENKKSVQS